MSRFITLQPSPIVDGFAPDGTERTRLPYPYHVREDGSIGRQDFWRGDPLRVVGFVRDPRRHAIDLTWRDVVDDPERAVGAYVIFAAADGTWATLNIAISQVAVTEGEELS